MAVESHRFIAMQNAGPARSVSADNLFQTPEWLADELVTRAGNLTGKRVLEPSAGLGRIYRAIRIRYECQMVLVEIAPDCARELYHEKRGDLMSRLVQADFLYLDVKDIGTFDAIVMNPPFRRGASIRHIEHAKRFLNPGGVLVGLCYAGRREQAAFGSGWELIEPGSFRDEGTQADAAIVTYRRDH